MLNDVLRKFDLDFDGLFQVDGLKRLDEQFLDFLDQTDPQLQKQLRDYRQDKLELSAIETSELLLEIAPHVNTFITHLFAIEADAQSLQTSTVSHNVVMEFKQTFVQRRARRYRGKITESFHALDQWLTGQLKQADLPDDDREYATAMWAQQLLQDEENNKSAIDSLTQWCALGLKDADGQHALRHWVSFQLPQRIDHAHLVPLETLTVGNNKALQTQPARRRQRDGFQLTDHRMDARDVQDQVHYCIYCHTKDGDFCSKGFPEKKGEPALGYKVDPLDVTLTGCPLDEKISEMHVLKRDGYSIAALAMAMVDNPMVPATGHRICNDCMKGCIYQKQDPVNIPQIETRVLTDVLQLPWGVEIYDLLTRWNPLRQRQYVPQNYNGRKVLIAGMGPAGFTMAHHLTMEGCAVVGIDGLKIEPLPRELREQPVKNWSQLEESLDERILLGFGGVAEYGITVRWDKNFLKLIYLTLARRPLFQVFGGVRLGGTITIDDAWEQGFDHVCVATGTGLPRVIHMGNSLARGMRQANDFLMALQLTGAGKQSSLANLQVRLPAVVIGGGLTAIDTATEVQAYYIKQVEKVLHRYEKMVAEFGEDRVRGGLSDEDQIILDEFLDHGRAVRAEREKARANSTQPDLISLLRQWGGVTLTYRKGMNASPAYVRNHEEIDKAMQEGIYYMQGLEPLQAQLDEYGHVKAQVFRRMRQEEGRWLAMDDEVTLPARSIFVAAGAMPNTIYEQEHPGTFKLEHNHFVPHVQHRDGIQPTRVAEHCKAEEFGPFTSYNKDSHFVSFIGDTNPVFHGSVVKAIASAKRSYPKIVTALAHRPVDNAGNDSSYREFRQRMEHLLRPRVAMVRRDNPAMTEIWVKAPMAARNFRPGQFYRLQTFESTSPIVEGTRLQVPLLTVSGTGVKDDMIRLLVLQWGAGPRLVGRLQPDDPIVLMGPTGAPTDVPTNKTIMVVAGRWGAAVMLDIGAALRKAGNRVLYVAAFGRAQDVDHQDELEKAADQIVWCTASEPTIEARREQDMSVVATDMVDLVKRYDRGELPGISDLAIKLNDVDRIMVMGGTGLLMGFQQALGDSLQSVFKPNVEAIATVGSPMQCMLKGVCAQCLQWQIDPETGERTRAVFTCAGQDQPLSWVDLDNLSARQTQNRMPDRLSSLWLDYLLSRENNAQH
ncbi:MAG: pyridine nucleotide-disulfide oxidoreductase [Gammaproteobacteria bacterium]|jgi:NADPH-dependent glutamate synthase beta subunit-like oxidoreductase/NAD(P)H-flavin reductase